MTEIEIDYKILSMYIIFGLLIIIGYSQLTMGEDLWTNKGKNIVKNHKSLKRVYQAMIILSTISGIYLIYYLSTVKKDKTDDILIYIGSLLLLIFSSVWAYNPYLYSRFVLGIVALGSILILAGVCIGGNTQEPLKKIAITATCIIMIQTTIFDFLIWTG